MAGISLYGKQLFINAYKQKMIRSKNNSPGGPGGIDSDAQGRLGYYAGDQKSSANVVAGSNKGRVQGICCGITAAWMTALLGGEKAAHETTNFEDLFTNRLRFQGAYVKDHAPNSSSVALLLSGFGLSNTNASNSSVSMTPTNVASSLPKGSTWAGYVSAYQHAIGIGHKSGRYLIMEPNGGLFKYKSKSKFVSDLTTFLLARRDRKAAGHNANMKVYFY
jgi:hypothetical protein